MFLGLKFEVSQMHKHGIAMKKRVKIKCMKFELEHWFATFMPWITIYASHQDPNDGSDLEVTPLQACE